jgi:hypothetical protein
MAALLSPIVATLLNVAAQILLFRIRRGRQYFRSIIEAFLLAGIALLAAEAFLVATDAAIIDRLMLALAVNIPTYVCLSYCYYSFVQLGQTSIRIRMYTEIALRSSGVRIAEIEEEYNESALTEVRLQRLKESGDMLEKGGRYFIGRGRLSLVANIIFAAKHFLLRKKSEFD